MAGRAPGKTVIASAAVRRAGLTVCRWATNCDRNTVTPAKISAMPRTNLPRAEISGMRRPVLLSPQCPTRINIDPAKSIAEPMIVCGKNIGDPHLLKMKSG